MCRIRILLNAVLLAGVLCMNLSLPAVHADGMVLPGLLSPGYLAVRYHHVTVQINDSHAVTRVTQAFYNPHPFPVSGQYLFPVPPDAMLSRFQATLDGKPQGVKRQDAAATNHFLYGVIGQQQDPSLLQYADWESLAFDMEVPAGGSRQLSLEYEQVLAPSDGLYRYRYVLSTERYSAEPLEAVSVTVNVQASSGLSTLYSPSHALQTEQVGAGQARATWEGKDVLPTEDFELFFAPAEGGFGGGLLAGRREGQDHFLFLFAPESEPAQGEVLPKDIVFVIDRSGSMSGDKMAQARGALTFILNQLGDNDRFSIVGFDDQLATFAPTLQPATSAVLDEARRFAANLETDGGTDLDAALQAGLAILARDEPRGASRMVVFVTDGLPTAGVTDETLILDGVMGANRHLEARLHVFGVGYDVNTHLLDRLAAGNGGSVTYVLPDGNLETALTDFYRRIARPALTDIQIEFEGMEASDLYPRDTPDLFYGSSLLLAGRYRATAPTATVRVRGRVGDEERVYVYRFALPESGGSEPQPGYDFVPRLWATRRIGELLDRVRIEGESAALVEEIQALGLAYGLVTPYTTFVIQAQTEGAASATNMALYSDTAALNQAWGQTTVQARVQNQLYQETLQANLASGANVMQNGHASLVQVEQQSIDLALLRDQAHLDEPITQAWIQRNIGVDRNVVFGSPEYFALAGDPLARPFLQAGTNVVFAHQGEVVAVQASPAEGAEQAEDSPTAPALQAPAGGTGWLGQLQRWIVTHLAAWRPF